MGIGVSGDEYVVIKYIYIHLHLFVALLLLLEAEYSSETVINFRIPIIMDIVSGDWIMWYR